MALGGKCAGVDRRSAVEVGALREAPNRRRRRHRHRRRRGRWPYGAGPKFGLVERDPRKMEPQSSVGSFQPPLHRSLGFCELEGLL